MRVEIERITPEMAKTYLENNCINRNVSENRVRCFAQDMVKGKWQLNGEAIQFNNKGLLVNGQHRLTAIIRANIPVEMVVIRDLEQDINIFDRGRVRSVKDGLIMSGISRELASDANVAVAKLHYFIQSGLTVVADSEVAIFLKLHEESILFLNSFSNTGGNNKATRINIKSAPIMLAIMYALESGVPKDTLTRFIEVVKTGLHDGKHEYAATICRNDIISGAIPVRCGGGDRKFSLFKIEKAIYDFSEGYPRKVSYSNWKAPMYSNNKKFIEQ